MHIYVHVTQSFPEIYDFLHYKYYPVTTPAGQGMGWSQKNRVAKAYNLWDPKGEGEYVNKHVKTFPSAAICVQESSLASPCSFKKMMENIFYTVKNFLYQTVQNKHFFDEGQPFVIYKEFYAKWQLFLQVVRTVLNFGLYVSWETWLFFREPSPQKRGKSNCSGQKTQERVQ